VSRSLILSKHQKKRKEKKRIISKNQSTFEVEIEYEIKNSDL